MNHYVTTWQLQKWRLANEKLNHYIEFIRNELSPLLLLSNPGVEILASTSTVVASESESTDSDESNESEDVIAEPSSNREKYDNNTFKGTVNDLANWLVELNKHNKRRNDIIGMNHVEVRDYMLKNVPEELRERFQYHMKKAPGKCSGFEQVFIRCFVLSPYRFPNYGNRTMSFPE